MNFTYFFLAVLMWVVGNLNLQEAWITFLVDSTGYTSTLHF